MASHDLGAVGAKEGKPVLVQWRWFNSKPTLPLWIGLLLLLIVPQENRKWQAWLILVVPLLAVAFRLIVRSETADSDAMMQLIVTFAIAWTGIWLLAPHLGSGSRLRAFFSALAVMFAVGSVGYVAYFGFWCTPDILIPALIYWTTGSVFLLLALAISGLCCPGRFHPGVIAIWMILWLPLLTTIGMVVTIVSVSLFSGGIAEIAVLLMIVPMVALMALAVSGFLYVVNLPVVILAGLTDCYRERLRAMVHRGPLDSEPNGKAPFAADNPIDMHTFILTGESADR